MHLSRQGFRQVSVVDEHSQLIEALQPRSAVLANDFPGQNACFLSQCVGQNVRVGHHPDLGALGGFGDDPGQRRKQLRMKARFGFVERNQRRQPIGEQGPHQRQELQRAIGQFRCAECALGHVREGEREAGLALRHENVEPGARKGVLDCGVQVGGVLPDMAEGGEYGREIAAVGGEER